MHLGNKSNEYVQQLPSDLYDRTPKAVFAAIAVSLTTQGGDFLVNATHNILAEWKTLHENGIIPQKPPTKIW